MIEVAERRLPWLSSGQLEWQSSYFPGSWLREEHGQFANALKTFQTFDFSCKHMRTRSALFGLWDAAPAKARWEVDGVWARQLGCAKEGFDRSRCVKEVTNSILSIDGYVECDSNAWYAGCYTLSNMPSLSQLPPLFSDVPESNSLRSSTDNPYWKLYCFICHVRETSWTLSG